MLLHPLQIHLKYEGYCFLPQENYFLDDGAYLAVKVVIEMARRRLAGQVGNGLSTSYAVSTFCMTRRGDATA